MVKIFVIHGMGTHETGWWSGDSGTLKKIKALKRYDTLDGNKATLGSLADKVEWHEIVYDDKCEGLREATNKSEEFDELISYLNASQNTSVSSNDLNSWKSDAEQKLEKFNPFNNNAVTKDAIWDVFLVANKLTRHYLAVHIVEQMLPILAQNFNERWGILAHSLGTALAQDVLNLLHELLGKHKKLRSPNIVALMANFSRTQIGNILVSNDPTDHIQTHVWPSRYKSQSMCTFYLSARHKLDPLSYLAVGMPKEWPNAPTKLTKSCYQVFGHDDLNFVTRALAEADPNNLDLVDIGSFNHSLENYLAHPAIYLPFFYRAFGGGTRYKSQLNPAAEAFLNEHNGAQADVGDFIQQLNSPNAYADLSAWIERLKALKGMV